jgi:hypothetical protein
MKNLLVGSMKKGSYETTGGVSPSGLGATSTGVLGFVISGCAGLGVASGVSPSEAGNSL